MTCCCQHPGYHRHWHTHWILIILMWPGPNLCWTDLFVPARIFFSFFFMNKEAYDTYCSNTWVAQLFFMVHSEQRQYIFILFCSILFVKDKSLIFERHMTLLHYASFTYPNNRFSWVNRRKNSATSKLNTTAVRPAGVILLLKVLYIYLKIFHCRQCIVCKLKPEKLWDLLN